MVLYYYIKTILKNPFYFPAFLIVLIIRIIRPIILIRFFWLDGARIGHLAGNPEQYMCEIKKGINKPKGLYLDFFYLTRIKQANKQLLKMWKRKLNILPQIILQPIHTINNKLPGGSIHLIGHNSSHDRDILNLFDEVPSHIYFTDEEIKIGEKFLKKIGIKDSDKIVCFNVRDSAYLNSIIPERDWSYHDFRNSDINDYMLAAQELTNRGYTIFRMGAKVSKKFTTNNPKIIDYATNGMRTEFLDIYLAYKCKFIVSTGSGWDAVAIKNFRKPTVYVNFSPLGFIDSYLNNLIFITKKYFDKNKKIILKHSDIYKKNLFYLHKSEDFKKKNIELLPNTPDEIREICIEMDEYLTNRRVVDIIDQDLQNKFWNIFQPNIKLNEWIYHGKIKAKIGSSFLRKNKYLIE